MDLALLIGSGGLDKQRILGALRLALERRGTHELPTGLVPPPAERGQVFPEGRHEQILTLKSGEHFRRAARCSRRSPTPAASDVQSR